MSASASGCDLDPNDITFTLDIKLSIPPTPMGDGAVNVSANEKAVLMDITVDDIVSIEDEFTRFTDAQLNNLIIYDKDKIEFSFREDNPSTYARKMYHFSSNKVTIKQFVDAIIDFEKITRPMSNWFDAIDCHHTFYEGIAIDKDGTYSILWGS